MIIVIFERFTSDFKRNLSTSYKVTIFPKRTKFFPEKLTLFTTKSGEIGHGEGHSPPVSNKMHENVSHTLTTMQEKHYLCKSENPKTHMALFIALASALWTFRKTRFGGGDF